MASGEALTILKEAFITLTPWQCPLKTLAFDSEITDKFILGLGVL
jgi:hypothetical protein